MTKQPNEEIHRYRELLSSYNALKQLFKQCQKESVRWRISDILKSASNTNRKLSEEEAQIVLENMIACHDPFVGINWQVIDDAVKYFVWQRELNSEFEKTTISK